MDKYRLIEELKLILAGGPWGTKRLLEEYVKKLGSGEYRPTQRTSSQNNALWKFFEKVADALVARGVTMRKVFEKTEHFDIPPTKNSVHDLWIYFQERMYRTKSTTELPKLEQIEKIHEVVMKNLGEIFEIDYIEFPNDPNPAPQKGG